MRIRIILTSSKRYNSRNRYSCNALFYYNLFRNIQRCIIKTHSQESFFATLQVHFKIALPCPPSISTIIEASASSSQTLAGVTNVQSRKAQDKRFLNDHPGAREYRKSILFEMDKIRESKKFYRAPAMKNVSSLNTDTSEWRFNSKLLHA